MRRRVSPRGFVVVAVAAALVVGVVVSAKRHPSLSVSSSSSASQASASSSTRTKPSDVPSQDGLPAVQYSPSNPPPAWSGPLPYPVLIADRGNNRMLEVTPTKQIVWQYPPAGGLSQGTNFGSDDDAFFTPDGGNIITNEEHDGTVTVISFYTAQQVWSFGTFGVLGGGSHLLDYPDDAYRLPNGTTIVADIRNCRELFINLSGQITQQWGKPQTGICKSDPANGYFGSPNGDTPQPNGDILMSLIDGNRIALMSPSGQVIWNDPAPDITGYVSDAQLLPNGDVLVADYNKPGGVVEFNPQTMAVDWHYDVPSGPGELDHPSLAEQLPNGNIILNDDYNDRVIVIDPKTNHIVWQYGVNATPGTAAGFLNTPDGFAVDFYRNWQGWLQQQGSSFQVGPFPGSVSSSSTASGAALG